MMLSTVFLTMLFTAFYGFSIIDAGIWSDEDASFKHNRQRRGYATPEDIANLGREQRFMKETMDKVLSSIKIIQEKLTTLSDKNNPAPNLNEKLQAFERKLDLLQRSQEEQESYSNKFTALEFTLNHVLSKVVYLSDNIPTRSESVDTTKEHESQPRSIDIEILARLNDLLRHVQGIKRDHCRRSTLPAAAGPVATIGTEKTTRPLPHPSNCSTGNFTLLAEELVKQIMHRLNTDTFISLQELPGMSKKHDEQLVEIVQLIKKIDKRLELWSSEELHQQNWQQMLQYCQDVSDEFSSFAGNSDALLKRIESFLRDVSYKIGDLPNRRKHVSNTCAGRRNSSETDESLTNATTSAGFDSNKVDAVPNKSDCHELTEEGYTDGIYRFGTPEENSVGRDFNTRYCAFAAGEHAWTVIQRRGPYDIQENFNRSWADYRDGFGDLSRDFWFGNEFIHRLTSYNNYELLIELENFENGKMSISYGSFGLDRERNNYSLYIGDYKGPGPDSLSYHCFMDFSTYDHNSNNDTCCACALGYGSGWWFDNCLESNLNGIYRNEPLNHSYVGIIWEHWLGDYSLKATRMLVRPKNWTLIDRNNKSGVQWLDVP